jgi:2-keto-4-pentenoate hydratase/2-oxohepta-3-ene-1,7-dioic acid hydratase in catechol pathway
MKVVGFELVGDKRKAVGIYWGDGKLLDLSRALRIFMMAKGREDPGHVESPQDAISRGFLDIGLLSDLLSFVDAHRLYEDLLVRDPKLLAPIPYPSKVIALGRNYASHAKEMGHEIPKEPIIFQKASSSIVGPEEPVIYHRGLTRIDHEVELAVVIGKTCRHVMEDEALSYVAGYTVLNDVTARDMQASDIESKLPWFRSKSFDTFCPIGPCITLPDEIPDPQSLDLSMMVNGEVRQKANTSEMIFPVSSLISYISSIMTLYPGDIIATGTPDGIGPVFPGDIMEAYVERIGVLRNPVVEEDRLCKGPG